MKDPRSDKEKSAVGEQWAEILMLQQVSGWSGCGVTYYWTSWGKKTALGIYETIRAFTEVE